MIDTARQQKIAELENEYRNECVLANTDSFRGLAHHLNAAHVQYLLAHIDPREEARQKHMLLREKHRAIVEKAIPTLAAAGQDPVGDA